ncbi:hypothetical protein [Nonomuraea sp. 10N515B]|uniref:hypothetical protein n=1 Tax=Nonomuraea sp. 10N515B TaxID=3457422 RepID=UPI003FCE2A79
MRFTTKASLPTKLLASTVLAGTLGIAAVSAAPAAAVQPLDTERNVTQQGLHRPAATQQDVTASTAAGRRFYVASTRYGWSKGTVRWGKRFISINGTVDDFRRFPSETCVRLMWRGTHNNNIQLKCVTSKGGAQKVTGTFTTNKMPTKAHVQVCSRPTGGKWGCDIS